MNINRQYSQHIRKYTWYGQPAGMMIAIPDVSVTVTGSTLYWEWIWFKSSSVRKCRPLKSSVKLSISSFEEFKCLRYFSTYLASLAGKMCQVNFPWNIKLTTSECSKCNAVEVFACCLIVRSCEEKMVICDTHHACMHFRAFPYTSRLVINTEDWHPQHTKIWLQETIERVAWSKVEPSGWRREVFVWEAAIKDFG